MKSLLRQKALRKREAMTEEEVTSKSKQIAQKLNSLQEYAQASSLLFYVSFRNEVQTHALIKEALNQGKIVYVPYVDGKYAYPSLIKSFDDLVPGTFKILEPKDKFKGDIEDIEVAVIPGAAFDRKGNRIGYGKGYYDTLLKGKDLKKVAICFAGQIVEDIMPDEHDVPMDVIVTEEEIIRTEVNMGE